MLGKADGEKMAVDDYYVLAFRKHMVVGYWPYCQHIYIYIYSYVSTTIQLG